MAGIGYDRPDSRKQRTQSDKQHGARAPIRCVSRFDTVSNHETECVDQDMRTARSLVCAVAPGRAAGRTGATKPHAASVRSVS
jgi:hypothetical protein